MGRPKVSEQSRRRVTKACLLCQASKYKCDGLKPCASCVRRDSSSTCAYSTHERSYGKHRRRAKTKRTVRDRSVSPNRFTAGSTPAENAEPSTIPYQPSTPSAEVLVPKISRSIYDTQGRVVYMGSCAALSFLQHIQDLFTHHSGSPNPTSEVSEIALLDEGEHQDSDPGQGYEPRDFDVLENLVHVFFTSTCGILDFFDDQYAHGSLKEWIDCEESIDDARRAVLFLLLACGAQARCASVEDQRLAQHFFCNGRRIALLRLTEEPCIETVHAFFLIHWYLLACSRRNAAQLNLGIAIAAAKSLGLHRLTWNDESQSAESRSRLGTWRSLCYHDLHFCAMMGRSPTTVFVDSAPFEHQAYHPKPPSLNSGQHLALLESCRAFTVMQRTVTEIYTKQSVSLGLLQQLVQDIESSRKRLPEELRNTAPKPFDRHGSLRNSVVACNYSFSMTVLTRPFLVAAIHAVRSRSGIQTPSKSNSNRLGARQVHKHVLQGAMISVESATQTIGLIHNLLRARMLFNNMPLITAWVFVSGLTVCSAHFGRIGSHIETRTSMQKGEDILAHFAKYTRQGRRYQFVLKKLSQEAADCLELVQQDESRSSDLFTANPARIQSLNLGNTTTQDNTTSVLNTAIRNADLVFTDAYSQLEERETSNVASNGSAQETVYEGGPSQAFGPSSTSITFENTSAVDLAHYFNTLNGPPSWRDINFNFNSMGNIPNTQSETDIGGWGWAALNDVEGLWDLNWSGSLI